MRDGKGHLELIWQGSLFPRNNGVTFFAISSFFEAIFTNLLPTARLEFILGKQSPFFVTTQLSLSSAAACRRLCSEQSKAFAVQRYLSHDFAHICEQKRLQRSLLAVKLSVCSHSCSRSNQAKAGKTFLLQCAKETQYVKGLFNRNHVCIAKSCSNPKCAFFSAPDMLARLHKKLSHRWA